MSKMQIETDCEAFLQSIAAWDGSAPTFPEALATAILHDAGMRSEPPLVVATAREFEVGTGMVRRWSLGTSQPHPAIAKMVMKWIHEETAKRYAKHKEEMAKYHAYLRAFNWAIQVPKDPKPDPDKK